ncbi:carboxymuconolactone decarboxylase family protein [Ensifer adhaerens]|uniref:carboxymuconolactone decarboxylase family protein n=1 Tax=Ensifer TaxID=106591 RepID=UPI00177DB886|nr:carboxymuconolactone decarboxylase family protein [Ensifer sp. ENS08]MBD9571927.1 carboxymuconolactone decarboxylase family protein [Ensifer sp. ENS08]
MAMRLDYTKIAPAGIKALGGVYGYIMECGLEQDLIEWVYLRVSQINKCPSCIDLSTGDLVNRGVSFDKLALASVWRESPSMFTNREQAALAWAETVTKVADTAIPDEAYLAATAVFSSKELVDLTIAIGLMNTYNRLGISFLRDS